MNKAFKIVEKIAEIIAWFGIAMIVVIGSLYISDVFRRLLVGAQAKGGFEFAQFCLCAMVFAAYAFTQVRRRHIHVGFIINHFPPFGKYVTSFIEFIMCFAICCVMTYSLWDAGKYAAEANKITLVLSLPFAALYFVSSIFMALFSLTILFDVFRCFKAIRGDQSARESIDKVYM